MTGAFEAQRLAADVAVSSTKPAGKTAGKAAAPPPPVHLLTATASLSQACGATRLLLAGHDAPVVKVRAPPALLPSATCNQTPGAAV